MEDKDKKRDPMPPPDATPEEIGEFWDTHSLAAYWDETHEVEFQVNLKSRENLVPGERGAPQQRDTLAVERGWQKLKELIQSINPAEFEKLVATLLASFFKIPFAVARSGDQPRGDARSVSGDVSMQAKRYTGKNLPDVKTIEGDIGQTRRAPALHLQVYVLAVSRDTEQLSYELNVIARETGLDIVTLELTDEPSDLGALCITFWEDICHFFDLSNTNQEFSAWVQMARDDLKTKAKMKAVQSKLEDGIQTQKHVQKDVEKYLLERFSREKGFNPINLSEAIERKSLEAEIENWWKTENVPVCYLEGEEGTGKTWLAAKWMNAIPENENVVTFWLDSKDWRGNKSIFDLLRTCFSLIYLSYEQGKIAKLQNKPAKIWHKTLIVLDGVNERKALEAAQAILTEYFRKDESEWRDRIRFLLTTRPLDNYPGFENYLWSKCHKIPVGFFDNSELQEVLTQKGLQPDDLPDSLKKEVARIPRYLQRCLELRDELGSFGVVTKEMVLLADLSDKIKHSDRQIKQKLGWPRPEDPKDFFLHLAKQMEWDKIDAAPERLGQFLKECFSDYSKIRTDLEEQRIVSKAGLFDAKLSADYVLLCWALYLSSLFDSVELTRIEDLLERFQQKLEPISQEDVRTEALFAALQLSVISPSTDLSRKQLSQKRAALMLTWFGSHNAQITDERISFWVQTDTDAYAQVVEVQLETHNSPNYEEILIEPLAKTWLEEKGQIDHLASRLTKWLLPTHSVNSPQNRKYIVDPDGYRVPVTRYDPQVRLSAAALSILSQRPDRQFLETLARCYEILGRYESPDQKNIGVLMRWGYTEAVLDDLHSLAKQTQEDELLLGIRGLAASLRLVESPLLLQHPFSEEDKESRAFVEQWNRRFKPYINRIRDQEKLLVGDSPADNVEGNYHGLDHLAVRKDLPGLCDKDQEEIKEVLHHVSVNAELSRSPVVTFEESCIQNLIPWVAKYSPESYAEITCSLTLNVLDYGHPYYRFLSIQGLILKPDDCEKITEAILGMKQRLAQWDDSSPDASIVASLLTEILLFSASEDRLIDWFEFLASLESLRRAIDFLPIPDLLRKLLPESIMGLAQQKLETLGAVPSDNRLLSNDESEKLLEREYWSTLYAYATQTDEYTITWAFEELRLRKPGSIWTFPLLQLALSDRKQFLDKILTDKKIRRHLFCKKSVKLIVQIYEGEEVPSYETLMSLLPPEIIGSFLCLPDRRDDLSRWGEKLMERMCLILQGDETNCNSVEELRFTANREVLQTWATHNTTDFLQLTDEYLTRLSESPQYHQVLSHFTDAILCLLLRFQPDKAMRYYHQWNEETLKVVDNTEYGVPTLLAQLWQVEDCNSSEHCQLRRDLLEECLNDEDIMVMTLAALTGGGQEELWNLVTQGYLVSPYAKERNLGVSILPWLGAYEAINLLDRLRSNDPSQWVRAHAAWAYEVAQHERSCREVYQEVLQTRDLFRISAVFEQIKPALSPTARWWHYKIEDEEKLYAESQEVDPKLLALVDRFWYRWGNSSKTKNNIEVFGRKLREYCRGEKIPAVQTPRIAPWWKPSFN